MKIHQCYIDQDNNNKIQSAYITKKRKKKYQQNKNTSCIMLLTGFMTPNQKD